VQRVDALTRAEQSSAAALAALTADRDALAARRYALEAGNKVLTAQVAALTASAQPGAGPRTGPGAGAEVHPRGAAQEAQLRIERDRLVRALGKVIREREEALVQVAQARAAVERAKRRPGLVSGGGGWFCLSYARTCPGFTHFPPRAPPPTSLPRPQPVDRTPGSVVMGCL
jgi:hypothetical protein